MSDQQPVHEAGVQQAWVYVGRAKVGEKVTAVPMAVLHDGEGGQTIEQSGEPFEVTVVE